MPWSRQVVRTGVGRTGTGGGKWKVEDRGGRVKEFLFFVHLLNSDRFQLFVRNDFLFVQTNFLFGTISFGTIV